MIRWALLVCLATFWLLSSMGQQNGSNNRNTVSNNRHDVSSSVANSTSARVGGNNTMLRKGGKPLVKRRIWKELLQELVTFKKNIWPILMGQVNSSFVKFGNKQTHRQLLSMIGDFRFIKTEILFIKSQTVILLDNITDARRDHKLLSLPLDWLLTNMTKLHKAILLNTEGDHRVAALPFGIGPGYANTSSLELADLENLLQQTNVMLGNVSAEILGIRENLRLLENEIQGTKENAIAGFEGMENAILLSHGLLANNISAMNSHLVSQAAAISALPTNLFETMNQMSQALNEIGKIVLRIDDNLSSRLGQLEQSMNTGYNFLASNISAIAFQLINHAPGNPTLPPNLLDAINQISQALNEVGKIVIKIDNNLSSGLAQLEQSMHMGHSFLASNISAIASQVVNQAAASPTLLQNLFDGMNQMSQALNEIGKIVIKIDENLNSRLGQLEQSMNMGHSLLAGNISAIASHVVGQAAANPTLPQNLLDAVNQMSQALNEIGKIVIKIDENLNSRLSQLEQSMNMGHSFLASNISAIASHIVNQAAGTPALPPNPSDANNQMSQALNEIGKIVIGIDENLSSGLAQLEQSMNMGHSFLASNISAIASHIVNQAAGTPALPLNLSDAKNQMSEALNEIGKVVIRIDENLSSELARLEQLIHMGHSSLASNISAIASHIDNQAAGTPALPPILADMLNQMSQALNEIGKIVIRIDENLSSGLDRLEQSMLARPSQVVNSANGIPTLTPNLFDPVHEMSPILNEVHQIVKKLDHNLSPRLVDISMRMNDMVNMMNTMASGTAVLQSRMAVMKMDLDIIKKFLRNANGVSTGNEVPAETATPIPIAPTLPYPTLPIYPAYPSTPPPFLHPGSGVPDTHVPSIIPTVPRPMWPKPNQQQMQPLHPAQFPTGPYGPGIPIGFANRFTGYCACTCPCPCICPTMDLGIYPYSGASNNSAWPFSSHKPYNPKVAGDCFCLCTCPCPRFLGISDQYYPVAGAPQFTEPAFEPQPVEEPGENGNSEPSLSLPSIFDLPLDPSTAGAVISALQDLLKMTGLVHMDLGKMQSETQRGQESSKQDLKDHVSKSLDYLLQLIRSNYEETLKMIHDLAATVQSLESQVQQSSTKSTRSIDLMSSNFSKFYQDISSLLSPSTLSVDRLAGHYPTAGSPLGLESPDSIPPGQAPSYVPKFPDYQPLARPDSISTGINVSPAGGQSAFDDSSTTRPRVRQSSGSASETRKPQDPSKKNNRTDVIGQRMLPIELEDPNEGGPDAHDVNEIERDKISEKESLLIEGCVRPVEQYAPLVIAAGVAYPFAPNFQDEPSRTDDDYDIQDVGETDQVAAGSWGIRHAMALPARRMFNGDILAIHDLINEQINNHLINVLQSNPVWRLHRKRKPRRPNWHRPRRPQPSKHRERGYRIVRLPAKPSSSLSAGSFAQRLPSSGLLPLISSHPFGHIPPKITMPGIEGPFPYSMSYNDGQGNSFSINVNRRNYPLMSEAYRVAASGEERLCRVGKK